MCVCVLSTLKDVGNKLPRLADSSSAFDALSSIAPVPHEDRFCGLRLFHGHIPLPHTSDIIIVRIISAISFISLMAMTLYSLCWA